MLDFKEYSELILDGVRPSLIETAECAFRAIFESTPAAPARSNLKTIPWEELAGLYGVDTEDCKVDGALNKKKLSRKMQTIPAVRDMFDFVHRAINVAKEEADLDAYPALDSDPRFNTMVSNIRTDLLVNCLKTAASNPSGAEWWKSDEFAAKLGQEIARKYMPVSPEQLYKGNKSSNEPSYASSGEFSDMDDKVVSVASDPGNAEGHPAYVDGNGYVWYLTESGDYRCSIPAKGNQRSVLTVYVTDGDINKITLDNSGNWDILVSSLGMFLAYGPELHLDPATGNFFPDLLIHFRLLILEYLPIGIIVDIAANRPSLLNGFDVAQSDTDMSNDFRAFGFVTRLVAEGILDGDALRDIRSRLGKTQEINARIAIVADCISPASYGRLCRIYRDICNSIQTGLNPLAASLSLISHFVGDFCSDDIIGLVTGESRDSRIRKQVFSDVRLYMRRIENAGPYNFYPLSETIHRYNSPGDAFFKKVFHSGNFNPDLAFNTLSRLSGLIGSEGMKNRKQLYADIRKHITPRVQRKLLAEDENRADELLDVLERTVPGFQYYTKGSRDIERMGYMDKEISPRDLLKLMLSFLSNTSSPTAMLGKKIAVELMRPATIARLNADHPDYESRRIKDLLKRIYTKVNTTMALLRGFDWGHDIDEPIAPVIENYFAPYVDQLQATLHTLSQLGYTGPALPKLFDWMLVDGSAYHLEKPDDASRLFLDEGGIFPSLHGEWWNEGILAFAITSRQISNFDLKAVGVSIAKETELFSKLCAGIAVDTRRYDPDATYTVLNRLVNLDKHWTEKTGSPLIPDADFANAMKSYPGIVLNLLPGIDKERSAQICEGIMTPEFMSGMVKTEIGLKTLLTLTSRADWFNFTTQFIRANQMNIENTLRRMGDSNQELVQKWTDYLSKINVDVGTRKAVRGTAASSVSETEIVYHEANGLQWMEKYLNDPSCGVVNPSSKVRLYTLAEVKEVLGHVADAGWRLPTVAELDHLGDNPDLIEEKQIGFTGTGHMVNGNYDSMANSLCYAWCAGEDGEPAGYSVMSNFIDTDDADIDPETDAMAIKLVR